MFALEGQDLPRTYLAHHELESVMIIIVISGINVADLTQTQLTMPGSFMLTCFTPSHFSWGLK